MPMWYKSRGTVLNYAQFFHALCGICNSTNATECHIEGGENGDCIIQEFSSQYAFCLIRPIIYDAPLNGSGKAFARRRKPYHLFSFSKRQIAQEHFVYSHEFLERTLARRSPQICFDPCIGKGLLSLYAARHGHSVHGIDLSSSRLQYAIEYALKGEHIAMERFIAEEDLFVSTACKRLLAKDVRLPDPSREFILSMQKWGCRTKEQRYNLAQIVRIHLGDEVLIASIFGQQSFQWNNLS